MKKTSLLFVFLLLAILSCEDAPENPASKPSKEPILTTSLGQEPELQYALNYLGFNDKSKNGRTNNAGVSVDVNEVIKVLQSDNIRSVYTVLVMDEEPNSLTNLIVEELEVGYSAFYQKFLWEGNELPDFEKFTGTIIRSDLNGNQMVEIELENGLIVTGGSENGRTSKAAQCVESIKTTKQYSDCGIEYKDQVQVFVCRSVTITYTITLKDCTTSQETEYETNPGGITGGTSGGGTSAGGSGGSYIPPLDNTGGVTPIPIGTGGTPIPTDGGELPTSAVIGKFQMRLNLALKSDPFKLNDIPCAELTKWKTLAQHKPNADVMQKLKQLDDKFLVGDAGLQTIADGSGSVVNMDYFPVTVKTLPKNPATNQTFTAPEFLNHIRKNINSFLDTDLSEFTPSTLTGINEEALWNSSNPVGTIMHIEIGGGAGDGSVVCSFYSESKWIFSTIEVPFDWITSGWDGQHPVSGNREFGYTQNPDGSYTFYTRGADRITDPIDAVIAENLMDAFENPDALWNSFKNGIYNFVQNNSGQAVAPKTTDNVIYRPDWEKVKEVLNGTKSITDLGCK